MTGNNISQRQQMCNRFKLNEFLKLRKHLRTEIIFPFNASRRYANVFNDLSTTLLIRDASGNALAYVLPRSYWYMLHGYIGKITASWDTRATGHIAIEEQMDYQMYNGRQLGRII